jgi:hypothetical protein
MSNLQRRARHEALTDWLGLAYRALYYALVSAPLWGVLFAFAIMWQRMAP